MIQRLALLLALVAGWVLVRWLMRAMQPSRVPRPATTTRFEGAMVRDRICETFLPRARALRLQVDGREHFFCSENCRSTFLSRLRASH